MTQAGHLPCAQIGMCRTTAISNRPRPIPHAAPAQVTFEVQSHIKLKHQGVAPLLAVFVAGGHLHLVFLNGGVSLSDFMDVECEDWLLQLASRDIGTPLQHLHQVTARVVHVCGGR